jgi:hypothetical protein
LRAVTMKEPRTLVERDLNPRQAAELSRRAEQLGLRFEADPVD